MTHQSEQLVIQLKIVTLKFLQLQFLKSLYSLQCPLVPIDQLLIHKVDQLILLVLHQITNDLEMIDLDSLFDQTGGQVSLQLILKKTVLVLKNYFLEFLLLHYQSQSKSFKFLGQIKKSFQGIIMFQKFIHYVGVTILKTAIWIGLLLYQKLRINRQQELLNQKYGFDDQCQSDSRTVCQD